MAAAVPRVRPLLPRRGDDDEAGLGLLRSLADRFDGGASGHPARVGRLARAVAVQLGVADEPASVLARAAPLHDVGKVFVADEILHKPGPLDEQERTRVERHAAAGALLCRRVGGPIAGMAATVAESHHEWWDGSGYPLGISQQSIALTGRIVSIADVFDALCSKRPYKRAWKPSEAARFVISGRNGQFDPDVVDAFIAVLTARDPELGERLQ